MFFHPYQNPKDDEKKIRKKKQQNTNESTRVMSQSKVLELLSKATSIEDQLGKLVESLTLTEEDEKIRKELCAFLQKTLSPYFERCKIYQFGSSINNFGAKQCDLDLCADFKAEDKGSRKNKVPIRLPYHKDLPSVKFNSGPLTAEEFESFSISDRVKLISRIIARRNSPFSFIHPIPSKRCPIVTFYYQLSDLNCDLSFNNRNACYNSRLLRLYGTNPVVKSVVMAVRHWAKAQELHLISSYALTWMVLFFLMYRQPQVIPRVWDLMSCVEGVHAVVVDSWKIIDIPMNSRLPNMVQAMSPVELLREFFCFYAKKVDWNTTALLTSSATFLSLEYFQDQFPQCQIGVMNMLDPFDLSHNVLQRVNEISMFKFMEEVKRAATLSHGWPSVLFDPDLKIWGLATLFVPNPDIPVSPSGTRSSNSRKKKKKDSAPIDERVRPNDYTIIFSQVKTGHLGCHNIWSDLVKKKVLNILQTVFMADMKEEINYLHSEKEKDVEIEDENGQSRSPGEEYQVPASKNDADVTDTGQPIPQVVLLNESPVRKELKTACSKSINNRKKEDLCFADESQLTDSETIVSVKNTGPPIPKVITMNESALSEELTAGCSNTTDKVRFHKQQSPPKAERKCRSLCLSLPCGSQNDLKGNQCKVSVHQNGTCNVKSIAEVVREKAERNNDDGSIQPNVPRMKRSSVDACLDKSSASETNSDTQTFWNSKYSLSDGQETEMNFSKPVSKRLRLLNFNKNEEEDGEEESKSFVHDIHHSKAHQVKKLDPANVMDVSMEKLPSLLQSSSKAHGFISTSTYSCICCYPVWWGRNKMRSSVMKSNKLLNGLALERKVSRKLIETICETQNKKSISVCSKTSSETMNDNDLEMKQKKALLRSLKEADSASQETSHSQTILSNCNRDSYSNEAFISTSPSDGEALQFSCEIIQKCIPQSGNPVVQMKFYPLSWQENIFKNFFYCVSSVMNRLVEHNLLDDDC